MRIMTRAVAVVETAALPGHSLYVQSTDLRGYTLYLICLHEAQAMALTLLPVTRGETKLREE